MPRDDTASMAFDPRDSGDKPRADAPHPDAGPGDQIGPYRILESIGEGGFGTVYLAEQLEPVRRRVAMKLLKPGMDSRSVIGRFEAERQALAMMDHPNIAKVLDAGQSPLGRPYFVMEFVRGSPITKVCDGARAPIRRRIALMREVCHAVQHAHQKGIIHRDIKPSNVLVTDVDGQATPKVIDFGIAKATSTSISDGEVYTLMHQMLGTPAYMSPEQAGGAAHAIDTRTDVYSLGALLYELLAGATPLDSTVLRRLTVTEIHARITEQQAPPMMSRFDELENNPEIARNRSTDVAHLRQHLRGELNWIVQKCLEKEPSRRYPTVAALDEDLRRYLEHEPVNAGPPSRVYMVRKFVRRNRVEVTAGALVALVLVLGFAGTAIGWARAAEESSRLRFTLDFFSRTLAGASSESSGVAIWSDNPELTLGEALAGAQGLIDDTFSDEPELESTIRQLVGLAQLRGGEYTDAKSQLSRAYEIRYDMLGGDDPKTLELLLPIAEARGKSGEVSDAFHAARSAYERYAEAYGAESEVTRSVALWIARWLSSGFRFADADRYFDRAMLNIAGAPDLRDPITLAATIEQVNGYVSEGRLARAETALRGAEPQVERLPDSQKALRGQFIKQLGFVLVLRGKTDEAIKTLSPPEGEQATDDRVRGRLLAWAYGHAGDSENADRLFTELLDLEERRPGTPFREIFARLFYAEVLLMQGRAQEAGEQASRAIEQYDAFGFQSDPDRLWGRALVAMADIETGRLDHAETALQEASGIDSSFPEHRLHATFVLWTRAKLAHARGLPEQADELASRALAIGHEVFGEEHRMVREIEAWIASL